MKLACLLLPRICCQKGPTLHFTYSSIARYPPAREEGASGRFFSGASSVIRNDQHPHHAVAIYVQTSDHFKGHEEHADVTAEMLLSRTSSARIEFELIDFSFDQSIVLRKRQTCNNCRFVSFNTHNKVLEFAYPSLSDVFNPGVKLFACACAQQESELLNQRVGLIHRRQCRDRSRASVSCSSDESSSVGRRRKRKTACRASTGERGS